MFAESPLLSLISRTAAKTEFVELTSSVITPYLALMWSILTKTQNKKMKVQQGDNKLSKIAPYLGLSILGLIWHRTISDFLENNFDPLANQLVSILLFLWQAPSAIFGWPAVFMQILGTCPYTIRPICPVHWSIFWNWICQIFITVIMDIWGLDIDDHINIEIYI